MGSEVKTLIGDDATIERLDFGLEKLGDAAKTLDLLAGVAAGAGKGLWLITAKSAVGSIFGGLAVGDVFPAGGDEVPAVGDKAKLAIATSFLDASEWSVALTAKEVDITLLKHRVMKYRKGKADADGTIKGIFTLGVTGEAGGLLNQFLKIVHKDTTGTITVSELNAHPLYIRGVIRDTSTSGETLAFLFGQIELFGVNMGAASGNKQEWSSKFRFTGSDPVYYEEEIA